MLPEIQREASMFSPEVTRYYSNTDEISNFRDYDHDELYFEACGSIEKLYAASIIRLLF